MSITLDEADITFPADLNEWGDYILTLSSAEERIALHIDHTLATKIIKDLCRKFKISDSELIRINIR
jgi:hypothetical protein